MHLMSIKMIPFVSKTHFIYLFPGIFYKMSALKN